MQVLDARDPQGTRCLHLERHLRTEARHKHLLFLLNKCDLVSPALRGLGSHLFLDLGSYFWGTQGSACKGACRVELTAGLVVRV